VQASRVFVSYAPAIDPVTGKPKLDDAGNIIPRIAPGTTNAPELTDAQQEQILANGLNYAGIDTNESVGIFAARTYRNADGEMVTEPDFERPVAQLVKRRTGGDGNRSPEAVEFLLPLGDGRFQRLDPGGTGRPEILDELDVQRLIYQGFEPQDASLEALRPQVDSPEILGRQILEAASAGDATSRRTLQGIINRYNALRQIGGQDAADAAIAEAGGPEIGQERLAALMRLAAAPEPAGAPRTSRGLLDAVRRVRDVAIPSTATSNARVSELQRNVTEPQPAAFDFQAEGSGPAANFQATMPASVAPSATGQSVVSGLRSPSGASVQVDAAAGPGVAEVFDPSGRESEILAQAGAQAPPIRNVAQAPGLTGEMPFDGEGRYEEIARRFPGLRPLEVYGLLQKFMANPDSWAAGISPAAADLARMLQTTRRTVSSGDLAVLPRGVRRTFDSTSPDPAAGTVADTGSLPVVTQAETGGPIYLAPMARRVRAARSAEDLKAELDALVAARGPGVSELTAKKTALEAVDARVQEQLAPAYMRIRELRPSARAGDADAQAEIEALQQQIDAAQADYLPELDRTVSLLRERTAGPAAAEYERLTQQITELERQYGLQRSAEGDEADAEEFGNAVRQARVRAGAAADPVTVRPGRRDAAETSAEDVAATRDVIADASDAPAVERDWQSGETMRTLYRMAFPGSKNYPLGLQAVENRPSTMREPTPSQIARFRDMQDDLAALMERQRLGDTSSDLRKEIAEKSAEFNSAVRAFTADSSRTIDSAGANRDRMMQVLLGGGTDRAPELRADRSDGSFDAMSRDAGEGEFSVRDAVEGQLENAPSTRSVRRPQAQSLSADAALQELLRGDAGDARAVIEGVVRASQEGGIPMTPQQVIYSMLQNYNASLARAASADQDALNVGRAGRSVDAAGPALSGDALRDMAERAWDDVRRMSPDAPSPSSQAVVGPAVDSGAGGRLRSFIGRFLRPSDIPRSAAQPDAPMPQDAAFSMLPDPDEIAGMSPDAARQQLSQLAGAEQQIAALETGGNDVTALRDRAQQVRNAIALRLQDELKPAPKAVQDFAQAPARRLPGAGVTDADIREFERIQTQGITEEEAAAARTAREALQQERAARAAAPKPSAPAFSQTDAGRQFLAETLRSGGYSTAAGRAYAVDAATADRLRRLASENMGDIVPANRPADALREEGDTSNPIVFGIISKGDKNHQIVAARESGAAGPDDSSSVGRRAPPDLEAMSGVPHDPNEPAPAGMEVVLFSDEGVPTFVRHDGGVKIFDARGRDVDAADEPVVIQPERRGAADVGPAVSARSIEEPVDMEAQVGRRARERQAARASRQESFDTLNRQADKVDEAASPGPADSTPDGARKADGPDSETRGKDEGPKKAPKQKGSVVKKGLYGVAGLAAGGYAVDKAQEAGYLPSNRDIVLSALGPAVMAIPGYVGDESAPEDTKQVPEAVVNRIRRARSGPYLTTSNFLPY
jgi:hypothetical protein